MSKNPDALVTTAPVQAPEAQTRGPGRHIALVIAWSREEPSRVGEAAVLVSSRPHVLGRGLSDYAASAEPMLFAPRLAQEPRRGEPVRGAAISRRQLEAVKQDESLSVACVGRCPMLVNGRLAEHARLRPGDTLTLQGELILVCAETEPREPFDYPTFAFGRPDAFGIVGEGASAWQLRRRLSFCARNDEHVLIQGPTGSGKELASSAIHQLSARAGGRLISRNAATLPASLIDAELFGNLQNYPNAGTPGRAGLVGAAHGGTLFLDEVGELAAPLQAHLLRVLDGAGEYQRLGEDSVRRSDFRLVAATNRGAEALKQDLAARLLLRVEVPGLDERREDIALIALHLVREAATRNPEIRERFMRGDLESTPRIAPALIDALIRHHYGEHVRELKALLWRAIADSAGNTIELTSELERAFKSATPARPEDLSDDVLLAHLAEHDRNLTRTAGSLGLSRHALRRLLKARGL